MEAYKNTMTGKSLSRFKRSLAINKRVLWALILREMLTRFGRENLGILWLILEPMMFISGITVLWTVMEPGLVDTGSVAEFAVVSYPTVLLWRNSPGRMIKAIESNQSLLHHAFVKPQDFFFSRLVLELVSATAAFVIIFLFFYFIGIMRLPYSILDMIFGWCMIAFFSIGLALIIGGLAEISEIAERLWHVASYFMLPISGAFFPLYIVSEPLRSYLMLSPLVDGVEFLHHGYYGFRMKTYFNLEYAIVVDLILLFLGLLFINSAKYHIEPE